jgi:CRP-like cAMP-binding protein
MVVKTLFNKEPSKRDASDIAIIAGFLAPLKFIQKIKTETSEETVKELSRCVKVENFNEGQVRARQFVFREGERGSKFFIVLSGRIAYFITVKKTEVETHEEIDAQLKVGSAEAGASFGELALLQDKPRAASVFCESSCCFGVINKDDYVRIIGRHARRMLEAKIDFLATLPIFAGWRLHNIAKLTYYMKELSFVKHKVVYREHEPSASVYIVHTGEFKLTQTIKTTESSPLRRKHFRQMHIANLAQGELIGVIELLEKLPWQHTCECTSSEGKLFKFSVEVRVKKDFTLRVMYQSLTTLSQIHKVKASTYMQRAQNLKILSEDPVNTAKEPGSVQPKTATNASRPAPTRSMQRTLAASVEPILPRQGSMERTMTNLSRRPDSFNRLRTKLRQPSKPLHRKSAQRTGNIHVQAIRKTTRNYFKLRAYSPFFVPTRKVGGEESFSAEFDALSLVRSFALERDSLFECTLDVSL